MSSCPDWPSGSLSAHLLENGTQDSLLELVLLAVLLLVLLGLASQHH